jgi:hypothetical protein
MTKSKTPTRVVKAVDPTLGEGRLKRFCGSQSDEFNNTLATQVIDSLWLKHSDAKGEEKLMSAALAAMAGIGPRDELEGMLAAQMVAAHNAAMECFRRSMISEQTFEGRKEALSQANKLSRTYTTLLEALNRHRGKGQQKVTVEHVHVHAGGQAIVGAVEAGGGVASGNQRQPHAKAISHASEPPLWGESPEREPVPVSGDAERPLPHARG